MFPLRQVVRIGARLTLTREFTSLQVPLFLNKKLDINDPRAEFTRRNTNLAEPQDDNDGSKKQQLGKVEAKMKLMFTCKRCRTRNGKTISKRAYEKGVVIVRCDGCRNNHLIADNLGWFSDIKGNVNIERIMAEKGESVRKILNDADGYIEAVALAELELEEHNRKLENSQEQSEKDNEEEESRTKVRYEKVGVPDKT